MRSLELLNFLKINYVDAQLASIRQINLDFFLGNLIGNVNVLRLVSLGSLNDIIYQIFFLNNIMNTNQVYLLYYKQMQLHLFY